MGKHWTYVPDPPWVRTLTWADSPPSIVTNDTKHLGHPRGPQVGQGSMWVKYNYMGVATQLPFCMTQNLTAAPLCVELKRGFWLARTPKEEEAKVQIHLLSIIAPQKGTENVTLLSHPPAKPLCKKFYEWHPSEEEVNWQDCYSDRPTSSKLNDSFSFVDSNP